MKSIFRRTPSCGHGKKKIIFLPNYSKIFSTLTYILSTTQVLQNKLTIRCTSEVAIWKYLELIPSGVLSFSRYFFSFTEASFSLEDINLKIESMCFYFSKISVHFRIPVVLLLNTISKISSFLCVSVIRYRINKYFVRFSTFSSRQLNNKANTSNFFLNFFRKPV